ncbi:hypothetical protein [Mycolicibacterium smegmatis]|uniref:Uncharacterized protein n=2 Tax=Mycolicibacterium smegmatis (strain ATCC 700084 / mc(2)155) TaxID=246196 RepID=A0R4R4_MYCS2|nr:hypothetical protein [Mycolicibacterium smegmatis]ABK75998.1 conserved hypothetical protein [Mycolicibacterium smegmatis MC2 155]AFP42200.1 hypothetical protein MSMEI_5767 [Mycolicibacterium smegmatis MC2 155]AIU10928.1 hypothetical protein LJ00_29305 [Mycolicibacterium smegmatis MC2 155]AIU17552.1 hypothetical protein LI99_29310 [Mycolicibacterium smegmatis]AIU24176.1 hypothetical protein LI98_29315 [Mycolicibacterium smegmatis]
MPARNEQGRTQTPDVGDLARSMLLLHGIHDDDDHPAGNQPGTGSWSKAPNFASDPQRAAAVREASLRDRERYLTSGLVSVDCRHCHVSVQVKKLGPTHTAVQWNSEATQRCAVFNEIRAAGGDPARTPSCPRLSDSIRHAVAEGVLEESSTAPAPGDG